MAVEGNGGSRRVFLPGCRSDTWEKREKKGGLGRKSLRLRGVMRKTQPACASGAPWARATRQRSLRWGTRPSSHIGSEQREGGVSTVSSKWDLKGWTVGVASQLGSHEKMLLKGELSCAPLWSPTVIIQDKIRLSPKFFSTWEMHGVSGRLVSHQSK